jgi:glycosyltransferase involved in cell wall biosynthesis
VRRAIDAACASPSTRRLALGMTRRIAHVIAEFSGHEAMGRTVTETARRVPGQHTLITSVAHGAAEPFTSVIELGGPVESFPAGRGRALGTRLAALRPDVVHLHGGALSPLLAVGTALSHHPLIVTLYAWPSVPSPGQLRRGGLRAAWQSNVLRPRVAATTLLPAAAAIAALHRAGVRMVLTPDPRVLERLRRLDDIPVLRLGSGAPTDPRRAHFDAAKPVVIFAGRAEAVRGVDTLIAAFRQVREQIPGARLRLLLIPRPELADIVASVRAAGLGESVELVTEPVPDLLAELAGAQLGVWPFKYDYTTSPPAMALVEACAVGLPVVGTSVACIRAVLEGESMGVMVRPADPDALALAMLELLTDRGQWLHRATGAPQRVVERLGWDAAAAVTSRAYDLAAGRS